MASHDLVGVLSFSFFDFYCHTVSTCQPRFNCEGLHALPWVLLYLGTFEHAQECVNMCTCVIQCAGPPAGSIAGSEVGRRCAGSAHGSQGRLQS